MIFRAGDKQGQTLGPLDENFQLIGGGAKGSLGEWRSWVLALLGCALILLSIWLARRRRQRYDLALRPMWVDITLGVAGCAAVLVGVGLVANRYISPITGDPTGVAYPVVILILVTLRHELPRPAPGVRPLRVRLRRQPGGRRARRHQHPPHRDVHVRR